MKKTFTLYVVLALLCAVRQASAQLARPVLGKAVDYVTKEGDTLLTIATKYQLAIEHLAFANGYPLTAVQIIPGTKLTIPTERVPPANPPRTGLVLNVPERGIYRYKDGKFIEFLPVAVGNPPDAKTPIGQFHIIEKIKNPTWYPPAWAELDGPVGPGPDNPLGDRWIGLSAPLVGIHGTNNPINVGGSVTHGCIRCFPAQIRELFEKVNVGEPVRVDYEVAKLGKRPDGTLVLVTFGDIYDQGKPDVVSGKLLKKIGKDGLLKDPNFKGRVNLTMGLPLDLKDAEEVWARKKGLAAKYAPPKPAAVVPPAAPVPTEEAIPVLPTEEF